MPKFRGLGFCLSSPPRIPHSIERNPNQYYEGVNAFMAGLGTGGYGAFGGHMDAGFSADAHINAAVGAGAGYGHQHGYGAMTSTGVILVLFILLVIVSRAFII